MEKKQPKNGVENHPDQKFYNRKRSNTISSLKRKNLNLITEINRFTQSNDLPGDQEKHLFRLNKDMSRCANFSLYGWDTVKPDIKYFASVFCGNKNCFVCNYARQKRVRRKYFRWFGENQKLLKVSRGEVEKVVTKTRYRDCFQKKGYKIDSEVNYDLMHLTLTVPHYKETGFNGDLYYFQKIADLFHNLRNEAPGWNDLVFGGEYGIETTQTPANGLHIHIHALLFVNHQTQNRNQLPVI